MRYTSPRDKKRRTEQGNCSKEGCPHSYPQKNIYPLRSFSNIFFRFHHFYFLYFLTISKNIIISNKKNRHEIHARQRIELM